MKEILSYLEEITLQDLATVSALIVLCFIGLYLHDWTRRFTRRH